MAKNGKGREKKQNDPKKELVLKKSSEKKSWKGRWITFTATAKEGGKPAAKKPVSFFMGDMRIADTETDENGKATHALLLKSGEYGITAKMGDARSNIVAVKMGKKAEDVIIRSRDIMIKDGEYLVRFHVLKDGDPVRDAVLCITKNGITRDLQPTDNNGEVTWNAKVINKELICLVTLKGTNVSIWKNFFKTI